MADLTIAQVREKFPQYGDMSDQQLADALHQRYYSDIPQADFYGKIGFAPQPAPASAQAPTQKPAGGVPEFVEQAQGLDFPSLPSKPEPAPTPPPSPRAAPVMPDLPAMPPAPPAPSALPARSAPTLEVPPGADPLAAMLAPATSPRPTPRPQPVDPLLEVLMRSEGGAPSASAGVSRSIIPARPMPQNPVLQMEGPGPGGGMRELYDMGILPRQYVQDPLVQAMTPPAPQEPDPFEGEGFGPLAARRGQQFARGATETVAAIPEALAIAGAGNPNAAALFAAEEVQRAREQIEAANVRLAENPDMTGEDRATIENVIADATKTIEAYQPLVDIAQGPIDPAAGDRGLFKVGDVIRRASEGVFGAPDPRDTTFWAKLAEGGGNMAGFVAANILTGPIGTAGVGGALNSSQLYKEAKAAGASEEDAMRAATMGGILGLSEAIPIQRALNVLPPKLRGEVANKLVKRLATIALSSGEEAAQEAFQGIGNNLIARGIYDPERGVMADVGEQALIGAILGGGVSATGQVIDAATGQQRERGPDDEDTPPAAPSPPAPDQPPAPPAAPEVDPLVAAMTSPEAPAAPPQATPPAPVAAPAQTEPATAIPEQAEPEGDGRFEIMDEVETVDGESVPTGRKVRVDLHTGEVSPVEPPSAEGKRDAVPTQPQAAPDVGTDDAPAAGDAGTPDDNAAGDAAIGSIRTETLPSEAVAKIDTDAETFQYKSDADTQGVTDRLQGVTDWDERSAMGGIVYEYADGRRVVADGHQRLGLAKRLQSEGVQTPWNVEIIRETDGFTPADVRRIAALKNIREGSGTAIDAAKVLREAPGDADSLNLPPKSALVRDARGLARLSDDAFGMVVNEVVRPEWGAVVGENVADPALHADVISLLNKLQPKNNAQAAMIAQQAGQEAVTETQASLFGDEQVAESLYLERAKVLDSALKRLKQDRQTFKVLSDRANTITQEGNVLNSEANAQRVEADSKAAAYLAAEANRKGPISDALSAAARDLKANPRQGARIVRDFLEALRAPEGAQSEGTRPDRGGADPQGGPDAGGTRPENQPDVTETQDAEQPDADEGPDLFGDTPKPGTDADASKAGTYAARVTEGGNSLFKDRSDELPDRLDPKRLGEAARDLTLDNGRRDGIEYIMLIDREGRIVGYGSGNRTGTGFAPAMRLLFDPDERIVVHHNHPSSSSFSPADVAFALQPGTAIVYAHAHDGSVFEMRSTALGRAAWGGDKPSMDRAGRITNDLGNVQDNMWRKASDAINRLVNEGTYPKEKGQPERIYQQPGIDRSLAFTRALVEAGLIEATVTGPAAARYTPEGNPFLFDPELKKLYDNTVRSLKRRAADADKDGDHDRPADARRHPGELERAPDGARSDDAARPGDGGGDQAGQDRDQGKGSQRREVDDADFDGALDDVFGDQGRSKAGQLTITDPPERRATKKWLKARDERIDASKSAGAKHLDQFNRSVEAMRGVEFFNVHDPKERGTVRSVANTGEVVVNWADQYSADKNLVDEKTNDGKKLVWQSWLLPTDLKDYVSGRPQGQDAKPRPAKPSDQIEITPPPKKGVRILPSSSRTLKTWRDQVPFTGTVKGWTVFDDRRIGKGWLLLSAELSAGPFDTDADARAWAKDNPAKDAQKNSDFGDDWDAPTPSGKRSKSDIAKDMKNILRGGMEEATPQSVDDFAKALQDRLNLRSLSMYLSNGDLKLNMIAVARGQQGQGVGSEALLAITDFADANGLRVLATPGQRDDGFGTTSRARLVKFYKRFGFVENKGRNKDFAISESLYREPSGGLREARARQSKMRTGKPQREAGPLFDTQQDLFGGLEEVGGSVTSPAFKRWFGDSKVVDEDGDPLILWHGTARRLWDPDFDAFKGMVWASEGSMLPFDYAAMRANRIGADKAQERLIDIYMRVERPFDADLGLPRAVTIGDMLTAMIEQAQDQGRVLSESDLSKLSDVSDVLNRARKREESGPHYDRHDFWYQPRDIFGADGAKAIADAFEITGFDGIKMIEGGEQTWGAFTPTQVKSPQNRGAFDPNDPVMFNEDAPQTLADQIDTLENVVPGWTSAPDGMLTNPHTRGGIIDKAVGTDNGWFIVFGNGWETADGFATRGEAVAEFARSMRAGTDPTKYRQLTPLFIEALDGIDPAAQGRREVFGAMMRPLVDAGLTRDDVTALYPYFTRFLDDLDSGKITLDQEAQNAPGTSGDLERDRGDAAPSDGLGKADVPASGRGDGSRAGTRGAKADGRGGVEPGGERVSPDDAAPVGTGRDQGVQGEGRAGQQSADDRNGSAGRGDGEPRVSPDDSPASVTGDLARNSPAVKDRIAAQRAADEKARRGIKLADEQNVRDTLPLLKPEQQDDVVKIERRFLKPDGHGMLLTNGTGTGKTYSGGGVVKRFVQQGKDNILILAPSQGILDHWVDALADMGVKASKLTSTTDAGQGVVMTTYANAGENLALAGRAWDLVVSDEAHKLSQNAAGDSTSALDTLRAISNRPKDLWRKSQMIHDAEWAKLKGMKDGEAKTALAHRLYAQQKADVEAFGKQPRAKVLFLSATPFAYDKNVDYAEGYLFNYGPDGYVGNSRQDGQNLFMVQNFGYRIRYHKLTKPDANVDSGVFEREFHEKLRREGVLSGRHLDIEPDYERRFVQRDDAQGSQIDGILDFVREQAYGKGPDKDVYAALLRSINKNFNYLRRMQLLEAIKAKAAQPDIDKHLALGRKVVIFHDYNVGGGFNPFRPGAGPDGPADQAAYEGYAALIAAKPEAENLNFTGYLPPVEELKRAYGKRAVVYNGTIPTKDRAKAKKDFNTDGSGIDIMIVQSAAGEAGISLHDITGGHQRALINLGMPTRPTTALQEEGRIRREGSVSDALFHYYTIGTTWERQAFAKKIAERSGTVENLALGNEARTIRDSFIEAYEGASPWEPSDADGKGGKERDRAVAKATPYEIAKTHYFGRMKTKGKRDQREGIDFYATPEPLGFKMVEWAGIRPYERVLEPSAGDAAIARYFPEHSDRTIIEPSADLLSRAQLRAVGAKGVRGTFEDYHVVNKHHVIVMNPPFGSGGKTAIEHLAKAATHLRPGGRIVALIPTGPSADARFDKWYNGDDTKNLHLTTEIKLPAVTFEKAGTAVATRIVIIDNPAKGQDIVPGTQHVDLTATHSIGTMFDRIEDLMVRARPDPVIDAADEIMDEAEAANPDLARPAPIEAPIAGGQDFNTAETIHGKTGDKLFVATATKRVSEEDWKATVAVAKRHGGWWSSFRGRGAIPGYQFKSEAERQAFLDDMKKPTVGFEQPAWHGSPHIFDRFSTEFMGSGEGAQAFGWGMYFAGRKGVAKFYRDKLSIGPRLILDGEAVGSGYIGHKLAEHIKAKVPPKDTDFASGFDTYSAYLQWMKLDAVYAMGRLESGSGIWTPRQAFEAVWGAREKSDPPYPDEAGSVEKMKAAALDFFDSVSAEKPGRLYKVEIPEDSDLLAWDEPLSEQPEKVRESLKKIGTLRKGMTGEEFYRELMDVHRSKAYSDGQKLTQEMAASGEGWTPENIAKNAEIESRYQNPDRAASLALRDAGIPGHRFLDQGSRGQGKGSYNYVIYDDSAVSISGFEQPSDQFEAPQPVPAAIIRDMMPNLRAEMDRLDLKRVRLFHDEKNMLDLPEGTQGMFLRNPHGGMAIVIAQSLDPANTMYHEVIHAFRSMNLFTPEEWRALEIKAARTWVEQYDIVARYPDLLPSEQIEEAIAEAFAEAATTRKAPAGSLLVRAFNKIARFLKTIRAVFQGAGFNTPEDVFGRVLAGQMMQRNAGNSGAMAALQEREQAGASVNTDTPEFKAWFGDSKVVDKNGKPLVMYHGSQSLDAIDEFKVPSADDFRSSAVWFSPSKATASGYGRRGFSGSPTARPVGKYKKHVLPVYLRMERPLDLRDNAVRNRWRKEREAFSGDVVERAKQAGYDGIITSWNEWLVFRPEQIKSVYNRGTFDPNDPRISYQAARIPSRQTRAHMASALGGAPHIPDRRIWEELTRAGRPIWARLREGLAAANDAVDKARIRLQDRFLPVLRAQEAVMRATGAPLPADHNAYLTETTFSGKVGRHLFEIDEDFTKPIIAKIAATKGGLTADSVGEWLTARHAAERNAQIAKINPQMPDGGSGMMTADAQAILAAAASGPHAQTLQEIGNLIDALRERTLKLREDAGLITHQEANLWRNQYAHYVPLKGFAETDHSEAVLDVTGIGRRFNVRGGETRRALGRSSEAFNPLQAAITQAQEVAIRAEKNRVGQALYNLAKDFPSPALWKVKPVQMKRFYNRTTGLVESRPEDPVSLFMDPNEMAVKVGGEEKRVVFTDPRLARAAGSVGADQMGWFMSMMSMAARYFSAINTMLDPEFLIRNAFRDMTAAQINIRNFGENERNTIAKAMIKHWPKAFVGAWRGQGNKADSEWTRYYREFEKAGAKVSFWKLDQPESGKADLEKRIRLAGGSRLGPASRFVRFSTRDNPVLGFIERTNLAVDNAIRLAAFVSARKSGWSAQDAAALAKNLTVNFNRRGEWGSTINALYPFANASIQGTQILFRAMTSKRMAKYGIGLVALGIILDAVNAGLSHEDDDGELAYDKIPDWKSRTNLAVMLGPDSGSAASIWLPYGYSLFPYLGQQIGKVARGVKEPGDAMADFAAAMFGAFSPITGEDFQSTLTPTMLDPINEMTANRDWLGIPIRPENPYSDYGPDAYKYYSGVSAGSREIADYLNRATGGTVAEPGFIDVSPEYIDHAFGFATGGAGRFYGRTADTMAKLLTGQAEEIESRNIPFYRSLQYETGDWLDRDRYYRFREIVREANYERKTYEEIGQPVPPHVRRVANLYDDSLAAERALREYRSALNGLEERDLTKAEKAERREAIDGRAKNIYLAFNRKVLAVLGPQGE